MGFRYTVQNIALQHNVHGYVRNLPDGRVELLMEGPDTEMDQLLYSINERMNQFIRDVKINTAPATGEFQRFVIKH